MGMLQVRNWSGYHREEDNGRIPERLRNGTLAYTLAGLGVVSLILYTGVLGYNFSLQVFLTFLPRQLSDAGASNTLIALLMTSLPSAITIVLNPAVSVWSDKTRSRFGRRKPFLLATAPLIALLMIVLGWGPELSARIGAALGWNGEWVALGFLCVISVLFNLIFTLPAAVIWYLFPDVIPEGYIARFMAIFQVIGSLGAIVFSRWFLPLGDGYLAWLYTGFGILYLLAMTLLCLVVKEGEYPPVIRNPQSGMLPAVRSYFTECFSVPFYYCFFLTMSLSDASLITRGMFNLLYAQKTLGISLEAYGEIMSYGAMLGFVLGIPLGWVSDKIHPLRFFCFSLLTVIAVNAFSFFYVRDEQTFLISSLLLALVYTMQGVCTIPVFVEILPKAAYGQFSSANALFRSVFLMVVGAGGGMLFDYLQDYQYIYAWDFLFTGVAFGCCLVLYWSWLRRGGAAGYVAPLCAATLPPPEEAKS